MTAPTIDNPIIPDVTDMATKLGDAVEAANTAALRAMQARRALGEVREELALFEAAILNEAYATGALNGKNQEERERNRLLFLSRHDAYQKTRQAVDYQSRLCDEAEHAAAATARELGVWHTAANLSTAALQLMASQVSLQATVALHPPKLRKPN